MLATICLTILKHSCNKTAIKMIYLPNEKIKHKCYNHPILIFLITSKSEHISVKETIGLRTEVSNTDTEL